MTEIQQIPESIWVMFAPWLKDDPRVNNVFTTREAAQENLNSLIKRVGPSPIFDQVEIVEYATPPL